MTKTKTKRPYILRTTNPKVKEFQQLLKSKHTTHTLSIIEQHRDILIDAILCYFHTLSQPQDIMIQTRGSTSSLARYTLYLLLREYGYTLAAISYTLSRSPATIIQGIELFNKSVIDNPENPEYTNPYMKRKADIPKPALLRALKQLREFNEELKHLED